MRGLHHGTTLYDPALLVPWVVWWPGQVKAGARLDCQRSLNDIMPSTLGLVGIEVPPGLDGEDLSVDLRTGVCRGSRPAYAELVLATYKWTDEIPMAMVRGEGWKFVNHTRTGAEELYQLSKDPGEKQDRLNSHAGVAGRLRSDLKKHLASRTTPLVEDVGLSPEERDQLRGLGYVE